jgi:hypothetical protein
MEPFLVFVLFGSICGAGASWSKGVINEINQVKTQTIFNPNAINISNRSFAFH